MKAYPRRFLPALVGSFAALALTGLMLVPGVLDLRFGLDVVWRLNGPASTPVAAVHAAAAFLVCGFAGALWSIHMRAGWHSRRHLLSGPACFGCLIGAALAALGVLYLGEPGWLAAASAAHTVLALAALAWAGVHWRRAVVERAGRREARTSPNLREPQSPVGRP